MNTAVIFNAIEEAKTLGIFKQFCDEYLDKKMKLRNILANSDNKKKSIIRIAKINFDCDLSDVQAERLLDLITAYLKSSSFRKKISIEIREDLLINQKYECAFCHKKIDISSHADHIVPFKYVGDELPDNLQMLCTVCNERKNDSLDYQIRYLLKLI